MSSFQIKKAILRQRNGYFNDLRLIDSTPERIKIFKNILKDPGIDRVQLLNFAAAKPDLQQIIFKDLKENGLENALVRATAKGWLFAADFISKIAVKNGRVGFVQLFLEKLKSEDLIRAGIAVAARYKRISALKKFLRLLQKEYEYNPWKLLGGDYMEAYYHKRYSVISVMLEIFPKLAESNLDFIEPYIDDQLAKELAKSIRTYNSHSITTAHIGEQLAENLLKVHL